MERDTFFKTSLEDIQFVPGDIETTGFYDDDIITTFTLKHDDTYLVWVNTNGQDVDAAALESEVAENCPHQVEVSTFDSDGDLLSAIRRYITASFDQDNTIFVFYNGEHWRGGFDLSFIRSVCLRTGAPFPFIGYAYLDLMPLFKKHDRFNVTHIDPSPSLDSLFNMGPLKSFARSLGIDFPSGSNKSEIISIIESSDEFTQEVLEEYCMENNIDPPEVNPSGLVPVYKRIARLMRQREDKEVVNKWSVPNCDPFGPDESVKAVEAYHDGEFGKLARHNIADVHKTGLLTSLLTDTNSIAKNEIQPKFF